MEKHTTKGKEKQQTRIKTHNGEKGDRLVKRDEGDIKRSEMKATAMVGDTFLPARTAFDESLKQEKDDVRGIKNGVLLDEYGVELIRNLGRTDDQIRRAKVASVKQPLLIQAITKATKENWRPVNLGSTYISGKTKHNLFAAVPAQDLGLGTVLDLDGTGYLFDSEHNKYPMYRVGGQQRFKVRLYNEKGHYRIVEFVHDSGAAVGIIKDNDSTYWCDQGDGTVHLGGYTGDIDELMGGSNLQAMMMSNGKCTDVWNINSKYGDRKIDNELDNRVKDGPLIMQLTLKDVLEEINKADKADSILLSNPIVRNLNDDKAPNETKSDIDVEKEVEIIKEFDEMLNQLKLSDRKKIMEKLKSAESLTTYKTEGDKRYKTDYNVDVATKREVSKELGLVRRMKVMEELSEKFPHLSMESMNRMVREGDEPGGIELNGRSKPISAAAAVGKGTNAMVHKKRNKNKGDDPATGMRAPFHAVVIDLIDLTNETEGNRWGYKWLLTIQCKEYGLVKVYPLTGKGDVASAWKQFEQWIKIITPYVKAKLGVVPCVMIVASDRGAEFATVAGRTKGELDDLLSEAGIARWFTSAGGSIGKIERFNRTLIESVNVMLRQGGAKNIYAYDAATYFETIYNSSPTKSNIIGKGEAPYKTLGIPMKVDKIVRFFCPAYIKLPKHKDPQTGEAVNQTKLTHRTHRCYIIGMGGGINSGFDTDGYKVVMAGTGEIYSSVNVKPTPELQISKSVLTGLAHDPEECGVLIRRIFDVNGEEKLIGENGGINEYDRKIISVKEEIDLEETMEKDSNKLTTHIERGEQTIDQPSKINKMTIGTGVTGQMRNEMNKNMNLKKKNKKLVMTPSEAKHLINRGRKRDMILKWVPPDVANKTGKSKDRYEQYWKVTTFREFDELKKRKKSALNADLNNDLERGFLTLHDNPFRNFDDEDRIYGDEDTYEETETGMINSESVLNQVSFTFGLEETNLNEEIVESVNLTTLESEESYWENNTINNTEVIDQIGKDLCDEVFLNEIMSSAKSQCPEQEVPLLLALAVYSRATVYVDGKVEPYTLPQAMRLEEWPQWKAAVIKEIQGLLEVGVWKEVLRCEVRPGAKILPGRLVFKIKTVDGKFDQCKARYVSRGDKSNRGEHYWESSSHQARSKSLKLFFSTSIADFARTKKKSHLVHSLDIKQAYLQRERQDGEPEIYMELPEETFGLCHDRKSGYVAKMLRHIYGEVDGGRAFERHLLEFLDKIGAKATVSDRMAFIWRWKDKNGVTHELKALAHVDDILYKGDDESIVEEFYRLSEEHFGKLTGGGIAEEVLGIKIQWDLENLTVKLSQRAHVEKFLKEFGYDPSTTKSKATPMPLDIDLKPNTGRVIQPNEWDCFKWCGFANWLASMTRVDMALVTNWCGRHSHNPGEDVMNLQKHTMRYLAGTLDEGLIYHGDDNTLNTPYDHKNKLIGYVDSMHGVGPDTMCVIIMLNGAAVIWRVLKQRVVTTSTSHSEMIALAAGARELQWATDFMAEIGFEQGTVRMMGDNQSANMQATGDYKSSKSDHYRRVQFYVEDNIRQGLIWIDKVDTKDNISDIGTKQVSPISQFQRLRDIAHGKHPELPLTQQVRDILNGKYDDP